MSKEGVFSKVFSLQLFLTLIFSPVNRFAYDIFKMNVKDRYYTDRRSVDFFNRTFFID